MSDDRPKPPRGSNPDFRADLDEQLRSYLREAQKEREEGFTLAALHRDIQDVKIEQHEGNRRMEELAAEQKLMRLRMDRHGQDIRELKRRVFHGGDLDNDIDTGTHQIEDLRKHLAQKEAELQEHTKERRDSAIWWKRTKIQWSAAIAGAAAMTAIGGLGTILWYLLKGGK